MQVAKKEKKSKLLFLVDCPYDLDHTFNSSTLKGNIHPSMPLYCVCAEVSSSSSTTTIITSPSPTTRRGRRPIKINIKGTLKSFCLANHSNLERVILVTRLYSNYAGKKKKIKIKAVLFEEYRKNLYIVKFNTD